MSSARKAHVPIHLDTRDVSSLPLDEIRSILRGTDDLAARGGRTLLCKLLKGSRDKDILQRNLDKNPSWGTYRHLSADQIMARIDWLILNDYLTVEYFHRLPLLCYTDQGLKIAIDTITDEILETLRNMKSDELDLPRLQSWKELPRATFDRLLQEIEAEGDPSLIPVLQSWAQVSYKKPAAKIRRLIENLRAGRTVPTRKTLPPFSMQEHAPTSPQQEAAHPGGADTPTPLPLQKLKIEWGEFEFALENRDPLCGDVCSYLDRQTGQVMMRFFDDAKDEELDAEIDADSSDRYLPIEPLDSHESFRIMEDFTMSLPESALKSRLVEALSRNKPFRRFRNIVDQDLMLRNAWFAFREAAHRQYARDWLEFRGIEPEWIDPAAHA